MYYYHLVLLALTCCMAVSTLGVHLDSLFLQLDVSCDELGDDALACRNSKCVHKAKRCDGHADCLDGSDEEECDVFFCRTPEYFRCANNKCISATFRCDDENDCGDYSDEKNCTNFKYMLEHPPNCTKDQWQCVDHLCIPLDFVCNGENDCLDGTDETLGCTLNITCDGFKCHDGHCVPTEWRCDGNADCQDKSDEADCDSHIHAKDCTLDNSKFLCGNNQTCIDISKVCDGSTHCPDKSDEANDCAKNKRCAQLHCSHQCVDLPSGAQCTCPPGYRTVNNNDCRDINECEEYGVCDQKCRNTPGSYECFCDLKYHLQADNRTCKVIGGEALMMFSSKTEIRGYFLQSQLLYPVAMNLKQVVGVNFDGHHVYWTDIFSEHESLVRAMEDGSQRELLVTAGLGSPEDLAVDWITGNIYFTDSEMQHIGVCANDGHVCTVLINKDVNKPRGIVLHPATGKMYWSDWGKKPEIAKSNMDGTEDFSFVSNDIHWPNGLAIDYPNERLYWTDGKLMTLESIRLDGTDRRMVLEGIVKHPYAIAVFEDRLYWSDWATYSIQSCDKFTGKNHTTLIKEKREYIYGLHVFHSALKQSSTNPCRKSPCSDMCLISGPSRFACACPQEKVLSADMHTCKEVEQRPLLAVGTKDLLIKIEHQKLGKHDITAVPTMAKEIGAIAYNPNNHTVFISDVGSTKRIIAVDINTGVSQVLNIDNLGLVVSMSFDYLGNNLYWCDVEHQTVEVLSLTTMSRKILLHDLGGETPMSIAVVPEEGILFLAVSKPKSVHIDRMLMDGTMRSHVIESGLVGPVALHYDGFLNRILWSDAGTGHIESTSVEGDDRHGFKTLRSTPVSVASLKEDVFWTNHHSKRLYWSKSTGNLNLNKKITLDIPEGTDMMHLTSITPFKSPSHACRKDNGNCSHICLPAHSSYVCACPLGMSLSPKDNTTCVKRAQCTAEEFYCSSTDVCIPKKFRCDGRKDCFLGEDEEHCTAELKCPKGYFQCGDGKCIRQALVCDMHFDCVDSSDERSCKNHAGGNRQVCDEHQCSDGSCIANRFLCDGYDDCPDGGDEKNCHTTTCASNQFRCDSGACIPKNWECDHEYDCVDMSDEHSGCAQKECSASQFACDNGFCIDQRLKCNSIDDCGDLSDELRCSDMQAAECRPNEFKCTSSNSCLPESARCNGTSECPHHEDEQGCSDCHVDEYECENKRCVPTMWLCDGHDDCGDLSDEKHCDGHTPTDLSATSFMATPCDDGFRCKSGECVDYRLVCNAREDCRDGSDENGACGTACKGRTTNPCDQLCTPTPSGPMCGCQQGFELSGDGQTCHDILECSRTPPVCAQLCTERIGNFTCGCYDDYVLRADRVSCKSTGPAMSMLFTVNNEIRQLRQLDHSVNVLHMEDTPRITGLDVDVHDDVVYFSIEESGTLHRIHMSSNASIAGRQFISDLGRPQKLAVDWITKNVYFVEADTLGKSIQMCNFDHQRCAKIIDTDAHSQVTALAVDAVNKYVFYAITTWWIFNTPQSVIYKSNMDGRNVHELARSAAGYVTGLAVDHHQRWLYYADQHLNAIGRVNFDGLEKTQLIANLSKPNGLNLFEDNLYFMTQYGYMNKCRLYAGLSDATECTSLRLNSYASELLALAQVSRQSMSGGERNPCVPGAHHGCSYLCAPTDLGASCVCEDGKIVKENEICPIIETSSRSAAASVDRRPRFQIHPGVTDDETASGAVVAGVLIPILIVLVAFAIFYVVKKRHSGKFNVSVRFNNPIYGVQRNETDDERLILSPGEHEYSNPTEVFHKSYPVEEPLMKLDD